MLNLKNYVVSHVLNSQDYNMQASQEATNLVSGLVDQLCDIFCCIGILLLAWGMGQFALALKDENADSKIKAVMKIVVSITLMSIRLLFVELGLLS